MLACAPKDAWPLCSSELLGNCWMFSASWHAHAVNVVSIEETRSSAFAYIPSPNPSNDPTAPYRKSSLETLLQQCQKKKAKRPQHFEEKHKFQPAEPAHSGAAYLISMSIHQNKKPAPNAPRNSLPSLRHILVEAPLWHKRSQHNMHQVRKLLQNKRNMRHFIPSITPLQII